MSFGMDEEMLSTQHSDMAELLSGYLMAYHEDDLVEVGPFCLSLFSPSPPLFSRRFDNYILLLLTTSAAAVAGVAGGRFGWALPDHHRYDRPP